MSSLPASADEAALETRIALLAGQPYSAVAGVLERGGERASATFLFICRRAKELPREEFDATVVHCFGKLPRVLQEGLLCLLARVATEALDAALE